MFGKHHTKESKEKNRIAHLGKKHKHETIELLRELSSGKNNPMYGVHKFGKDAFNWQGKTIEVICDNCGKKFKRYDWKKTKSKHHFCSRKCMDKYVRGENHPLWNMTGDKHPSWQGGKSFEPYSLEFNRKLKEQIRNRDEYRCQECNQTQEQLGYKLCIHHIDYNKKNNCHDNLISLCRSCHSQTGFDREDWSIYFKSKLNESNFN
jgi:hypothetical protein